MISGCGAAAKPSRAAGSLDRFDYALPALGTGFHVTFFAAGAEAATSASDAVASRLADLESKLAPDRADSELGRLCAGAGGPPRKVSDDLFAVLELAQRISKMSDGAFDVTAAPYISLWKRAREAGTEPTDEQLAVVRPLVGWKKLRLDPIERTAALETAGMRLHPGALALGYATDRVLDELKSKGVERAFIETEQGDFGRVRRFGAAPPGQTGWGLLISTGDGSRRLPGPVPTVANTAIASSTASRLLDPLTGKLAAGRPVAVVVARSGAAAGGLATAAAVLGPERGEAMARSAGAAIRFEAPSKPSPSAKKLARRR